MIDERILYEQAPIDLIDSWADKEDFAHGWNSCNKEWKKTLQEIPRIGVWIPTDVEEPEDEYLECFVTVRMNTWTDPAFRFTTKATWIRDGWYWKNGKPMKNRWDILAWQKIRYPNPYEGE